MGKAPNEKPLADKRVRVRAAQKNNYENGT